MTRAIWFLKNFDLFKELPTSELQMMERMTKMIHVQKGEALYLPGDPSDTIYMLKIGMIEISRLSDEGKAVGLDVIGAGEIFGELALTDEPFRASAARALENSLLCVIPKQMFEDFLRSHPDLALGITKLIGLRRRRIESRLADLTFKSVPNRLAQVLLNLAEPYGKDSEFGRMIQVRLTHKDLACLSATTRETASALISEWKKQGILNAATRKIAILNTTALQEIAGHSKSFSS